MNRGRIGVILFAVITATAQAPNTSTDRNFEILSVCAVLKDLPKYNGKIIAVRGVVEGSSEGGSILDRHCTVRLVTNGYLWPTAIALELPTTFFSQGTVDFDVDWVALQRVDKQVQQMRFDAASDKLWLTYVGLFETREKLEVGVDPDGKRWPVGFGHLSRAPGRLIVKTAINPFIARGKKH
jgi:hypothetical protein